MPVIPPAPTWTLLIDCPGQRPTKLTYYDPAEARHAAWRFRRSAEGCRIDARTPEGRPLRGRKGWRKALARGRRLGQPQKAVCVLRKGKRCMKWRIDGHYITVR
jgi:hypothetical protein